MNNNNDMSDFQLVESEFVGAKLGTLFQSPDFFHLHSKGRGAYFEWIYESRVVATVHFSELEPGVWRSPACGTFAGYAFDSSVDIEHLQKFHSAVCTRLKLKGARSIEVLLPPMAHDIVTTARQFYMLLSDGFEIISCNLNHSITVDNVTLLEKMSYGNRKRIKKCLREGLLADKVPLTELTAVYEALDANRRANGHTMSMTLCQLEEMVNIFPDSIVLFGIRRDNEYAAAALTLRLSADVLYVFYWGDRPGYHLYSPVVGVANAIYSYCSVEGIPIMDIGTSTLNSEPNHGLIRFKQNLGFTESLKFHMKKTFSY